MDPRATSGGNGAASAAYDRVPIDEVDRVPLRVAISPLPMALTIMRDALQDGRRGTPAAWRKSILSSLRARDAVAFAPLTDPETTDWPSLLDDVQAARETFDDALQRLAAIPGSALLEALESDRDLTPSRAWDAVRRDPDRWLDGYVDALFRGWRGLEPLWRSSTGLVEREEERVIAAVGRGVSAAQLVNELTPAGSLCGGDLRVTGGVEQRQLRVGHRGLAVIPMVAGSRASTVSAPREFLEWIAYSLPDAWRAFDGQAPPPASLQALLGVQRTAVLERLDRPLAAGRLAEVLGFTPARSVRPPRARGRRPRQPPPSGQVHHRAPHVPRDPARALLDALTAPCSAVSAGMLSMQELISVCDNSMQRSADADERTPTSVCPG